MKKYSYLLFPAAILGILLLFSRCDQSLATEPVTQEVQLAQKTQGDDNYSRVQPCYFYHRMVRSIWGVRCVPVKRYCNCIPRNVVNADENSALISLHNALQTQTVPDFFDTGDWDELFPALEDSAFAHWRQGLIDGTYTLHRIDGDSLSNNGDPVQVFAIDDPAQDTIPFVLLTQIDQP